jgi:superfamily II DNA or RNA helicase/intein/homing endonuclease
MQLRPYQSEAIAALFDWFSQGKERPLVVLPTGCHAKGTHVIMFDGTTKLVEDVSVGDILMGDDNSPRVVLRLARGSEMMYKIIPKSGEPFIVNENHILALRATNEGKKWKSSYNGSEFECVSVKDFLLKTKYYKHIMKLYRVDGVDLPKQQLPLDPYFLGVMLGDGSMKTNLALTSADSEVVDYLYKYIDKFGCYIYINRKKNSAASTYCIGYKRASKKVQNPITKTIREIGLWGRDSSNKFVPEIYKKSSREDRLQLLAGLIDTDGSLSRGLTFDYISKSKLLSEDVQYIARSVGLCANIRPCEKRDQNGRGGTYYRVTITGDVNIVPVKIKRKKGLPRRQKKNPFKTGFSIEKIGVGNFYGFELDGNHLYLTSDFIVHHNTGKSLCQASFIQSVLLDAPYVRVLCVTHSKELVQQNCDEIKSLWPACPAGIFSAGIGRRDASAQVLFAGIQSVWNKAATIGHFDLIIVDEAHAISGKNQATTYHKFFDDMRAINPNVQVVGLTATPYRLDSGNLVPLVFDGIAYEYDIVRAIHEGYLCEIVSAPTVTHLETLGVKKVGGEFAPGALERAVDIPEKTYAAVQEIIKFGSDRNCWLVFAAGNTHARHITEELIANGVDAACLTQDTPKAERDELIRRHKSGELKCLVNNMILTTGFNNPRIDLIACLRPTHSAGLWVQMVGRGMRLFASKLNCLLLDFGRNLDRHGPIDKIRGKDKSNARGGEAPSKICPSCQEIVHAAAAVCPNCGFNFPQRDEPDIQRQASDSAVFSTQETAPVELQVYKMSVRKHVKDPLRPASMMVTYTTIRGPVREFVFFDHPEGSKPYRAAIQWMNSDPFINKERAIFELVSADVDGAVGVNWSVPSSIVVVKDGKYYKIKERKFQQNVVDK